MKKSLKSCCAICLLVCFSLLPTNNTYAAEKIQKGSVVKQSEYDFQDVNPEVVKKMKENFAKEKKEGKLSPKTQVMSLAYSDITAQALAFAGFNDSAYLLQYSMLTSRVEPLEIEAFDSLPVKMWNYSPEFKNIITSFLYEARSNRSYEYFKETSISFNMPYAADKRDLLTRTDLRSRTDLFGSIHAAKIYLGVVKSGISWDIIVMLEDRYDFLESQHYGLADIVNNMAYYDQVAGKVRPYDLYIYADRVYSGGILPFGVPTW